MVHISLSRTQKILILTILQFQIRKNSKLLRQGGIYKDELEYTRSLIPSIKIDVDKKDQKEKIKQLEEEITHLRDIIKTRDNEIYKLKREIHKLKVSAKKVKIDENRLENSKCEI